MSSNSTDASRPEPSPVDSPTPADSSHAPNSEQPAATSEQPAANSEQPTQPPSAPAADPVGTDANAVGASPAAAPPPQRANPHDPLSKRKLKIGSRLGLDRPKSLKPQVAGADKPVKLEGPSDTADGSLAAAENASTPASPPATPAGPLATPAGPPPKVPKPSVRDPLSPDLEAELNEALSGASIDQLLGAGPAGTPAEILEPESRHRAKVVKLHGDNVFLSLSGQNEAVASVRQFEQPPEPGAFLDVVVKAFNAEDGLYEVAVPGASISVEDWSDLTEGTLVEARVTGANTGGLECKVNNIRGFIPASQVSMFRVEDFAEYVDQRLQCLVTEVNPQRRNLVLSRRAVLEREKQEQREQLLQQLEVGQVRDGVVRGIRDFGAFVDLGGVDGLVHVSQLSWERVGHPSEVLEEGQKVRVKIDKIDPQTGKIGLSIRSLEVDPWSRAASDYPVGTVVKGTVSRIAKFGAFVRLGMGVEGLIHISELSHSRIPNVASAVREGEAVQVKVLSVDTEAQRIALSLKATIEAPAQAETEAEEDEPPRELAVKPQRSGPLKGGTDRPSGGEQFGLKW